MLVNKFNNDKKWRNFGGKSLYSFFKLSQLINILKQDLE